MWEMIQDLPADKDYLQVLSLSEKDGKLAKENFEYSYYSGKNWWDFGFSSCGWGRSYSKNQYIEDLKSIACYQGYSPDDIDKLLGKGFSPEEIEEYIYYMGGEI